VESLTTHELEKDRLIRESRDIENYLGFLKARLERLNILEVEDIYDPEVWRSEEFIRLTLGKEVKIIPLEIDHASD